MFKTIVLENKSDRKYISNQIHTGDVDGDQMKTKYILPVCFNYFSNGLVYQGSIVFH